MQQNPIPMRTNFSQQASRRLVLVWGLLSLAGLGLCLRLVHLQAIIGAEMKKKARLQQTVLMKPYVLRRKIIDRNGTVMALDRPAYMLYAYPLQIPAELKTLLAKGLAQILGQPEAKLLTTLQLRNTQKLDYWMTEEVADRVRSLISELKAPGFELVQQRHRLYPQKDLAAEVLGFVDAQDKGQAGIEQSQEDLLLAKGNGEFLAIRDGQGKFLPNSFPREIITIDNSSLQLTIDQRTQLVARQALVQQIKKYDAKRGAVMVLDVRDGGLRALVTHPTYDPNYFYKAKPELFKNWAVSDLYEPGSTFKPINVAIALEVGAIQADTVFNDEGKLIVGGWPVANFDYEAKGAVGALSISQILQRSSNVGMVHIIQTMKPAVYYDWLERLGLGESSKIDLYGDRPSSLKSQEQFITYSIEPATAAFGQGFSLTPMQMLQIHGLIASGGKLLTPHLVKGLVNEKGEITQRPNLPNNRQIFSPSNTAKVLEMMKDVVELGTGKGARIPGYRLGGKTGTSQKAGTGGYSKAKITSFVGIFPIQQPRFVVLAVIDEPIGDDAFGSTVAAPIVKTIIEDLIVQEGISPTHPQEMNRALTSPKP